AEPKLAEKEMYEAMELELKLVNFSADDMVRRDPDRGNNRFQLWQLKSHFPLINFEQYVTTVFKGLANVSPNHTVIIREIEYFTGIQMQELTAFLKGEFIKQLNVLDWMDESTRRRAVEKAGMIEYKNGFPEVLFNDTWMDEHWGIIIKPKEYLLHLTIRIKLARYAEELMRLDQPLDRTMWYQSPAQVDAYYAPNNNEMRGRYDELGNLNDWWDTGTAEKFTEKT
ncbi:hypothetical protein TELCIR_18098, partial [Teladorsagia circumcincta]